MEEQEEEFAIDPAMAAQMGFSAFGSQPGNKKRKYAHSSDAVVDVAPASMSSKAEAPQRKTGANATELGIRGKQTAEVDDGVDQGVASLPAKPPIPTPLSGAATYAVQEQGPASVWRRIEGKEAGELDRADLEALAKGARNQDGDVAYFKPSFVEDPWARLRARAGGAVD